MVLNKLVWGGQCDGVGLRSVARAARAPAGGGAPPAPAASSAAGARVRPAAVRPDGIVSGPPSAVALPPAAGLGSRPTTFGGIWRHWRRPRAFFAPTPQHKHPGIRPS